ncbi:MAG: hypothetical protein E6K80_09975, partial [Candidatus Eisenbacteria bacterium]
PDREGRTRARRLLLAHERQGGPRSGARLSEGRRADRGGPAHRRGAAQEGRDGRGAALPARESRERGPRGGRARDRRGDLWSQRPAAPEGSHGEEHRDLLRRRARAVREPDAHHARRARSHDHGGERELHPRTRNPGQARDRQSRQGLRGRAQREAAQGREGAPGWKTTAHSLAWQTLVTVKKDATPECIGCHVVGYKAPGGFQSSADAPRLVNVQCENCHGMGTRHEEYSTTLKITAQTCQTCHHGDNDPEFNWDKKLPMIAHGNMSGETIQRMKNKPPNPAMMKGGSN